MSPINGKQYHYLKETTNGDAIFVIAKEVRQQVPISRPILVSKKNQEEEIPALPNEKLDRIYRSFLSLFTLHVEHKNLLKEEGWGKDGCQAGMQIGIVQNPADEKKLFYITEGEKKAYVGHYYLKSRIVNLTGVNCFHFLTQPNGTEEPILSYIKKRGVRYQSSLLMRMPQQIQR